jgi:glycosyltransferase involved in cell wall biosynthesis
VHLLCQEQEAESLDWVDAVGRWRGGELRVEGEAPADGSVTAYVPDVGGLLPVYVADRYEGFEVKTFAQLGDDELERYLEANVAAVREVAARIGGAEAALANHLVMGPAILARAGLGDGDGGPGFAVKIHGSALEYTVKPEPERFLPHAREGVDAASGVLVGSRHTAESLWEALGDPGLPERTRLGPPGVDVEMFRPVARSEARVQLERLSRAIREGAAGRGAWARDLDEAAGGVRWLAEGRGPRVVFVGKLIVSKGVDLLLAAWSSVVAAHPGARLLVVGFGEYRETLETLWAAIERGDLDRVSEIASAGRELEGGEGGELAMLAAFLRDQGGTLAEAGPDAEGSVAFAGRLEHDEVGELVPAADAVVFPSTFPEAFGMVAAEAASAGVLPVSADHSGLAEVSRELRAALPVDLGDLVSFPLGEGAVDAIAERLNRWLALPAAQRREAGRALREVVERLWSWEGVARGVIAASQGQLDELPVVRQ